MTPEYNHGTSGVLKNAIDYLYAEWNNKAVGFVSYGGTGGARAAEHLRLVAGELQMADVRQQVTLSLMTEFENFSVFKPGDYNLPALNTMLDQVVAWSTALAPLRDTADGQRARVQAEWLQQSGKLLHHWQTHWLRSDHCTTHIGQINALGSQCDHRHLSCKSDIWSFH